MEKRSIGSCSAQLNISRFPAGHPSEPAITWLNPVGAHVIKNLQYFHFFSSNQNITYIVYPFISLQNVQICPKSVDSDA